MRDLWLLECPCASARDTNYACEKCVYVIMLYFAGCNIENRRDTNIIITAKNVAAAIRHCIRVQVFVGSWMDTHIDIYIAFVFYILYNKYPSMNGYRNIYKREIRLLVLFVRNMHTQIQALTQSQLQSHSHGSGNSSSDIAMQQLMLVGCRLFLFCRRRSKYGLNAPGKGVFSK